MVFGYTMPTLKSICHGRLRWCPLARLPLTQWLSIFVRADLVLSRKSFSASTTRGFWLLAKRVVPETLFSWFPLPSRPIYTVYVYEYTTRSVFSDSIFMAQPKWGRHKPYRLLCYIKIFFIRIRVGPGLYSLGFHGSQAVEIFKHHVLNR
jgi:hypothetical protein